MPFIPQDDTAIAPRATTGFTPPVEQPPYSEAFGAAFRQGNIIGSALAHQWGSFEPMPGYNPLDDITGTPYFDNHADRFFASRSPAETATIKRQIDREESDKRILASTGAIGVLAQFTAGMTDPTMLLPGRVAIGAAKEAAGAIRGAAEIGGAMAVQSTMQEAALQATQQTRTPEDSVLNVGSATILGALIGGPAASVLSRGEREALAGSLTRERGAMDAHVATVTPAADEIKYPQPSEPPVERLTNPPGAEGGLGEISPSILQSMREARGAAVPTPPTEELTIHPDVMRRLREEMAPDWQKSQAEAVAEQVARQEQLTAEPERAAPKEEPLPPRTPIPENFPHVIYQQGPSSKLRLIEHPDFEAAKNGDIGAALRVVRAAVRDEQIEKIKATIGDRNPVLVPVVAASESGHFNTLPLAYAEELHERLGLDVNHDVKQIRRVHHTDAEAAVRIANRTGFVGDVEPGRDYFLVDDHVVQGGTLADLRSHIEDNGGNVIGATTLISAKYSHILGPKPRTLGDLRSQFPDLEAWWHEQFGHGLDSLTESEAHYLTRFSTFDALRNRVLGASRANDLGAAASTPRGAGAGAGLKEVLQARVASGATVRQMADEFGVSPMTISRWLSAHEIEPGFGGNKLSPVRDRLKMLLDSGETFNQSDIAREFGISRERVRQLVNEVKENPNLTHQRPRKPKAFEEFLPQSNISEWETLPDGTMLRRAGSTAGAAAADARTLQPVRTGIGLEKIPWDPVVATLQSPSISARRAMADLADVATLVNENLHGQTTTLGGGPSLETMARLASNQTQVKVRDTLTRLWGDLRFSGERIPFKQRAQLWLGVGERGGSEAAPTFEQFKEMVSDAMMKGDEHAIPQVQEAAQFIRREVFEPWAERAEKVFPEFQRQEAEVYFPHVWRKQQIEAQRPEFVNKLVDKFWNDQNTKRSIQDRLRSFSGAMESHQDAIDKLTRRIDERNAKLKAAQTELDEVSRQNREAFRRAGELREANTETARQKAVELGRQQTAIRDRLNKLSDRVSGYKHEIEDLDHRLQAEHLSANAVREKIEEEVGRWEGKSASEAKSALKQRAKDEAERTAKAQAAGKPKPTERLRAADKDVDLAVKRILKTDQNRSLEDIRDQANETTDRILSSPDGRLAYDEHQGAPDFGPRFRGGQARGSLARRTLDVDNEFARGWVEPDIERVVRDHLRTFVPDVLLAEKFGDVEMSAQIRAIEDEFAHLVDQTGPKEAERVKLDSQRDSAIENVAAIRDLFRGLYNIPSTAAMKRLGRISTAVRNANVPLSLGMATISSLADAAGAVFRWGMVAAFRDGWTPFVKSLMTNREYSAEAMKQFRAMGIAIDTFTAQRHREFSGVTEAYRPGSPLEKMLQFGADKFNLVNMLGPWTDLVKSISSAVAAEGLYRAAKASTEGTATAKQLRALAENNITGNMAMRIAKEYERSGNVIDGTRLPNTESWTDQIAREHFEGALSREANIAVVTPGLDKPLLFSDPVFSMLLQFKSFTAAATGRIMIANLQRADAETLQGLVASLGMGMLSYKINAITGGQPTSDRPQDWIKEAMSRGNVLGWIEEGNALASKMTRGGLDIYRLIGADKPLSKFAAQSAPEQLMGPTFGKMQALAKATSAASGRDWSTSDTKALRRIIPTQNLFYLRGLFNQVEEGANNAFGIQAAEPRTATRH